MKWICAGCGMLRRCKCTTEDEKKRPSNPGCTEKAVDESFLKRPKGVLHVLQQLGIVGFNLRFTVLHRVLNQKINVRQQCQNHFL